MSQSVEEILSPITQALVADGYQAVVSVGSDVISVTISATSSACEECLSPPEVIEPLIADLLSQAGRTERVDLVYPAEWHGSV